MKVLKTWLQDYVKINLTDNKLDDLLTYSGTLVDNLITGLDNKIIVAKITNITKHPNADKLQIATIDTGSKELQVVCGASNIAIGQKVPLAPIGTKLPEFEIKEADIRGIKSYGMLCSKAELGIDIDDHSGIYILPNIYEIGKSLNTYIPSDTIFDLEITPNRGDCLSHIGIAREISSITGESLKIPALIPNQYPKISNSNFTIKISNPTLCPRYYAVNIEDVKIKESPAWLQNRLLTLGQKPINNIVDITNYIMLDLGQPLHAFDTTKISGNEIIIRPANKSETITTLDEIKRNFSKDDLVIADSLKPIALAGIMGGANSHIDNNTTKITLEAAEFNPIAIRKTAKTLNLSSDASYRFERGIDPEMVEIAIDKAAKMIKDICDGKIISKHANIAKKYKNPNIAIEYDKINNQLGTNLSKDIISKYLTSLGFSISDDKCHPPSWRHDVKIWQDLSEEIARIYDINNITKKPIPASIAPKQSDYYYEESIKDILVENGFVETINYPFLSQKDVDNLNSHNFPSDNLLEISNPLQSEYKFMRNSLIPALLKNVSKNPTFDPILIFELGHVFTKDSETVNLCVCISGKNASSITKNIIHLFRDKFNLKETDYRYLVLKLSETFGYKIRKNETHIIELPIANLIKNIINSKNNISLVTYKPTTHYRPVSKFPSVTRDLAFILDSSISSDDITSFIYDLSPSILCAELFDEFTSEKFGKNKKNIAFHIYLQKLDSTLTDDEANIIIDNIISKINNKFQAVLRN